jgi:hypothetical protein
MKKFILQVILFSTGVAVSILLVFLMADGNSDAIYMRFTSPQQQSLILGASRAAQGLQPSVFNELFAKEHKSNLFYNYSFTIMHSPYGSAYFNSIQKKMKPDVKDGIYIVTVDPWSISSTTSDPDDSLHFEELHLAVAKTNYVNFKPNLFYLINCYDEPYYTILSRKYKHPPQFVHNDGWLEVNVPMDSISANKRLEKKIKDSWLNSLPKNKFSEVRLRYLIKIISFLKTHGKVYLVRLPVHERMLEIENSLMPQFDSLLTQESYKLNVDYFNFKNSSAKYSYTDGNHLYKTSGKELSAEIAKRILQSQ